MQGTEVVTNLADEEEFRGVLEEKLGYAVKAFPASYEERCLVGVEVVQSLCFSLWVLRGMS